jgi:hypothetical protein
MATELNSPSLNALIAYCDGDMQAAERDLSASIETLRQVGHLNAYANRAHLLADVKIAAGELAAAEALLRDELGIGIEGGSDLLAVRASAELAILAVYGNRLGEADQLLSRCRTALACGEDWGRRGGRVLLAESLLATMESREGAAGCFFEDALSTFRARRLPWDEADCFVHMARILELCGAPAKAAEMIESARTVYERIGAGSTWLRRASVQAQ